jgi:Carboxypeptidase regulatory-like domain/GDSL-like Lipase/Acylhydrolase family
MVGALSAQFGTAASATVGQVHGIPGTPGFNQGVARVRGAASIPARGVLKPLYSSVLRGGYVSAGVGLRDLGHGRIVIAQIPSGSTVVAAFLLWDVLDNSDRASDARGQLNGTPFVGTLIGTGSAPCWPASNNYAFFADVTKLVSGGNGGYTLTGMPSSLTNGDDPWNGNGTAPFAEGASLVVVYRNASSPLTYVGLSVGGTETPNDEFTLAASFSGFSAASPTSEDKTTFIVADGQSAADGPATFDGTDLVPGEFQGSDPQAVPPYSLGDLWDTSTYNIGAEITPGSSAASATITGTSDCLVWVGQVLSVVNSSGASGKVIVSFGDSVSAGEGGPVPVGGQPGVAYTGYSHDSSAAYPQVLAANLDATDYNFSQSGACAMSSGLPNCQDLVATTGRPNTVEDEIRQAAAYNLHPNLITLTVGADDISFAACMKTVVGIPLASTDNPCSDSSTDLSHITANVLNILKQISAQYPGVPVLMTRYYFPFPASFPVNNSKSICGSAKGLYLLDLVGHRQYEEAAKELVTDSDSSAASRFLNSVVSSGQSIAGKLDNAILAAVTAARNAGMTVSTVKLDFVGHDLCQDYPGGAGGWVLAPSVFVFGSYIAGLFSGSATIQYSPSDTCAVWKKEICGGMAINKSGTKLDLTVISDINDIPHPTVNGQKAIARQLAPAAASLIGGAARATGRLTAAVHVAAPAADTPGTISGTVTDAADPTGLAGVCVLATSADGGGGFGGATTASDGTYQISNLPPDAYTVEFDSTCGGTVSSSDAPQQYSSAVSVAAGGSATGIDATLAAGGSISGTVTDAANPSGLAGVCVTALSADGGVGFASVVTAADGTYTLSGLSADSYTINFDPTCNGISDSADLAQSTAQPVPLALGAMVTGVDAVLAGGGSISGTVTDAGDPSGVAGVCVTALSADAGTGSGTATTDGNGNYVISDLPPDSYQVEFDPTCAGSIDSVDAPQFTASPVTVTAGSTSGGVNAVLATNGSITGQVTDPANPSGAPGVCVFATADSQGGSVSAITDGSGSYSIGQLPPGSYTVQFDPSCGGTVSTLDLFQITASPVAVSAGGSTTANATLSADGGISGTITDAGNPGGLAGVCLSVASADNGTGAGSALTLADGTYAVTGLPPGTYTVTVDPTCSGRVRSADVPRSVSSKTVTAGSYTDVSVGLSRGGAITGKVTDKAHPGGLHGVCVTAASSSGGSGSGTAITGSGGTYHIKSLPAGSYLVIFDPRCAGRRATRDIQQSSAKPVRVAAGTTTSNVNAHLVAAVVAKLTADSPPRHAVRGRRYSYTFKAGGRPAPVFALYSGQLPPGLTLNVVTGALSGKPTKKGTFSFRISASNGYGKAAVTPKLTISVATTAHR